MYHDLNHDDRSSLLPFVFGPEICFLVDVFSSHWWRMMTDCWWANSNLSLPHLIHSGQSVTEYIIPRLLHSQTILKKIEVKSWTIRSHLSDAIKTLVTVCIVYRLPHSQEILQKIEVKSCYYSFPLKFQWLSALYIGFWTSSKNWNRQKSEAGTIPFHWKHILWILNF